MDLHAKDKSEHAENVELLSAQKPITDFKGLIITLVAAVLCYGIYHILPYETNANKGLALLLFVAILWFTEAVHITITALMVPVAGAILAFPEMDIKKAMAGFADPTIYIFFGGFALATAMHMQRLDRKIAVSLLMLSRGNMKAAVLMMFGVTAFLSMWISNTATAAMMLPLAMGMMDHLDKEKDRKTFVFVLLGIAYCASIGGLGTVVGSPPNMIAAKALDLDFVEWMKLGLPMMLLILPLMLLALFIILKPNLNDRVEVKAEVIPWTLHRVIALMIFLVTACAWIFSSKIKAAFGIANPDTVIALMAAIAVVVFGVAQWKEVARNTDWGVLMLFGGGISLSALLQQSGASLALGQQVATTFSGAHPLLVILVVAAFIIFLTEFTSNTASAALLVPIFATIAAQMGLPEEVLVFVIGIGASCAFMLPVATPPNAIVFGTGMIRQKEMMNVGILLNIMCVFLVAFWAYFMLM
ncbi:anion:sodium symporter [Neisseria sp. N95_16]|uniref:DASS family sodium-coupled anion symporter n=1 Tax=Neisseria brasiliensis TaxID=2666100 RepID=A0A5Q3S1C7_9NEIS|nr:MULTISPECIES: DASS family sodium-coupled anion symporter [Neisseria]MRN39003.1 DASS family sodium-coupled anion symporter [Neisseria brasiliensis]PJO10633.1 anion:sodium symporter [Neisseria sp. N95_16]PJO78139.1 anion:sodium symporter [Neisseria sp. N177_16]QGL25831.1 DASS family sodium-coupled anion symporter [Neisseria brasiliensis]